MVALFAFQFAAANIMLRMDDDGDRHGMSQAAYYNWHKSIGLVALVVAVLRLLARRQGPASRLGADAERSASGASSIAPSRCCMRPCS